MLLLLNLQIRKLSLRCYNIRNLSRVTQLVICRTGTKTLLPKLKSLLKPLIDDGHIINGKGFSICSHSPFPHS